MAHDPPAPANTPPADLVARLLHEHGDVLWRFALARTRSEVIAEDIVQETFLAALKAAGTFAGASAERTWLLGIAHHKIMDHFRKVRRRGEHSIDADSASDEAAVASHDGLFAANGHWRASNLPGALQPGDFGGATGLRRQELLTMLRACLDALPPSLSEVVWLRDCMGISAEEVCKQLGLTTTNLWTRAHRARAALRLCIERRDGGDDR